jgi:hypothetical protein
MQRHWRSMLALRESQGGFVGKTGTVWTINSDCSFTVSRFVNDQTSEPQKARSVNPRAGSQKVTPVRRGYASTPSSLITPLGALLPKATYAIHLIEITWLAGKLDYLDDLRETVRALDLFDPARGRARSAKVFEWLAAAMNSSANRMWCPGAESNH